MRQDCLSHLALLRIERAYSNMVDTDEKLLMSLNQENVVPRSFSNQFLIILNIEEKMY